MGSIPGHSPGVSHTVLEEPGRPCLPRRDEQKQQLPSELLMSLQARLFSPQRESTNNRRKTTHPSPVQ